MEMKVADPRRIYMGDVIKWRLPGAMPELQRKHRGFVTAKHVAKYFGFPVGSTQIGIRKAARAGRVKQVRVPGWRDWIILSPNQPMPDARTLPLNQTQTGVLIELRHLAVNGRIGVSRQQLSLLMGRNA